jgi:hypothetical protein
MDSEQIATRERLAQAAPDPAVAYLTAYVEWRRKAAGFNKLISSSARQRAVRTILALHFAAERGNPDEGATVERVLAYADPPVCGLRVLRTTINLAQHSGLLMVQKGHFDRRQKTLSPTASWIALEAERHRLALARLRPDSAETFPSADLVARFALADLPRPAVGITLGEPDGVMGALAALEGGLAVICAVADAWVHRRPVGSHKEIGRDFRISGSQVRKILHLAADCGRVALDREGRVADASRLAAACKRLAAHDLALYARCLGAFETPGPALETNQRAQPARRGIG